MTATAEKMKISALAPWYGSKRTLAAEIVKELGDHKAYWEPFCGGMAVLFAKPKCRLETVNDLHSDLINLARVVRHPELSRELYHQARLVMCADDELAEASNALRVPFDANEPSIDRALSYLVGCRMGRNGECGLSANERGRNLCIRWTNGGGAPGTRWAGVVRTIGAWHRRLAAVTVTRRDAFEMLEKIADEPDAAIYCDPPYIVKSDTYCHDFTADDHNRLAHAVRRFQKARVVVSYYMHDRLLDLYPGWTLRKIEVTKASSHQSKRGENKTKATEVLLINGKSYTAPSDQLFGNYPFDSSTG